MKGSPTSAIAGCFSLAAFMVAIVTGLLADNPASTILVRALIGMVICYPIGLIVGLICNSVIDGYEPRPSEDELLMPDHPDVRGPDAMNEIIDEEEILTV